MLIRPISVSVSRWIWAHLGKLSVLLFSSLIFSSLFIYIYVYEYVFGGVELLMGKRKNYGISIHTFDRACLPIVKFCGWA